MLRFFKSNSQVLIALIPLIGIVLWLPVFLGKASPVGINPQLIPLGEILPWLVRNGPFQAILSYFLVILLGFYLVRLNTRFQFIRIRTQLPAVVILLLLSPLAYYLYIMPVLILAFPVLFAIERTFDSFAHDKLALEYIDAAFLISLSSFIFFPIIFAHLLIFMILVLQKNNTWREWVFTLIGGAIPFLVFLSLRFVFDWEYKLPFEQLFKRNFSSYLPTLYANIFLAYLVLLIVLGSINMIKTFGVKKIQSRKLFLSLFGFFLFGLLSMVLPSVGIYGFILALIPSAYLISHFFHLIRYPKIGQLLFIVLFLVILFQEFLIFFPVL
ncbi:MAG: hypothetical protein ACOC0R_00275 [Mariniphaga sp.]